MMDLACFSDLNVPTFFILNYAHTLFYFADTTRL